MRRILGVASCVMSGLALIAAATVPTSEAGNPFRRTRTSVEDLAEKLDKLECALQYNGRVTVKAPDVWGQARLTAYRQEFETIMAGRIGDFTDTLQGEISVSDQAFLSEALSIAAASKSNPNNPAPETGGPSFNISNLNGMLPAATVGDSSTTNPTDGTTSNTIVRTAPIQGLKFTNTLTQPFSLEPEILLDERKRFINHLQEIRRINEGDDTAEATGYVLNLVRIPVSVIPGDKTRENYGAEVTVTAESHVTEELLVPTFRELVINDLVDQLAFPVVKYADLVWQKLLQKESADQLNTDIGSLRMQTIADLDATINANDVNEDPPEALAAKANLWTRKLQPLVTQSTLNQIGASRTQNELLGGLLKARKEVYLNPQPSPSPLQLGSAEPYSLKDVSAHIAKPTTMPGLFTSRDRRARYPIPASQLRDVIGPMELARIVQAAFLARDRYQCRDRLNLVDVQGFLRNELQTAYDFLNTSECSVTLPDGTPAVCSVWQSEAVPSVSAIRRPALLGTARAKYFGCPPNTLATDCHSENVTEALGWAILIEASLLNQKLNEDIQQVSQNPNCNCLPVGQQMIFYGNQPDPTAKRAFADYVKCRWPIRVFALDPVAQQQNIADTFSLRREMQVALALAFQRRFINTESLTRYMRRIEQDIRTIAINNTVVGFGSGDDTFGWRFFPRLQTPDIEGNLTVLTRDLIIGGPNRDAKLKQYRIEPGMRECVALVVMPSFVRHVQFDVRTNWFPLVPCHTKKFFHIGATPPNMEKTVEWSKLIRSMEDSVACCVQDQHLYRDGEVERLLKRSHQLSRELPLNTLHAQVPYENILGGFEMFSAGVTDLAPELVGFYGAPGINPDGPTELFLVGKNFNLTQSQIIAGNVTLKPNLLSRQVMRITIPKGAQIETRQCTVRTEPAACAPCDCTDKYVEVRLGTPYGVSNPLLVPLKPDPKCGPTLQPPPPAHAVKLQLPKELDPEKFRVRYLGSPDSNGEFNVGDTDIRMQAPHRLELAIAKEVRIPTSDAKLEIRLNSIQPAARSVEVSESVPASFNLLQVPLKSRGSDGSLKEGYAIEDANFRTLQLNLRSAVVGYLQEHPDLIPTTGVTSLTVSLEATIIVDSQTKIPTTTNLSLPIQIAKKP